MQRILNKNCGVILNILLNSSNVVSSSDIKASLSISRKTLTAEMLNLDTYLSKHGARIRTVNGIGYSIDKVDDDLFKEFQEELLRHLHRDRYMYYNQNFLAYLIVIELLLSNDYINVDMLVEKYYYSSSTISQNLQKAKKYFEKFDLKLISRPNYGILLKGSEWNKRICILFTAKIVNGIHFLQEDTIPILRLYREMFIKDEDNYLVIHNEMVPVLQKYKIHLPYVYQMHIANYVFLTQKRLNYYDLMEFRHDQVEHVQKTNYYKAAKDMVDLFEHKGYILKEKDTLAFAIMLDSYSTRYDVHELDQEHLEICADDVRNIIIKLAEHYPGAEQAFDDIFFNEFTCYMAELRMRLFYQLPSDEESIYPAKNDGALTTDFCIDFARIFYQLHGIRLTTPELLHPYYIFSSSSTRNVRCKAIFRAALVSLYGEHFARDVAARLMRSYDRVMIEIVPMELTEIYHTNISEFDLILTDIAKNHLDKTNLPVVIFDIYREQYLRSIDQFISDNIAEHLRHILKEENIIRGTNFRNKEEVFEYLANKYVVRKDRDDFIEDCRQNDNFISNERKNKISLVSTFPQYYNKGDVVVILNKTSFYWDHEPIQMILFFNRRGMAYRDMWYINTFQKRLLGDVAGIAQLFSNMNAEEMITHIASCK